jgi:CBS domain-containing protein/nucleotide-binding universal stress UspA family protein
MYRHILVGIDATVGAQQAFVTALDLARLHGATLTLLSVEEHLPHYAASVGEVDETVQELSARFRAVQATAVARATEQSVEVDTVIAAGAAAQVITRTAQAGGHDLIVIGASRHGSLWSGVLGTTADRVVETAPCSVLVVRHSPLNVWAGEVMQRDVVTVHPETPIAMVVELLIARGVKAVPVVDPNGWVVGIITGGDLLERAGLSLRLSLQPQVDPSIVRQELAALAASGRIAADVMTTEVTTIDERTSVREAARLMAQQRIKRLPVIDRHGRVCGILSRADVLRHIAAVAPEVTADASDRELPLGGGRFVRDVFDPNVPTVSPATPLDEVVGKLVGTALRRVVVVDPQRHVLGMITDADLIGRLNDSAAASLLQVLRTHLPFLGADDAGRQALSQLHTWQAQDVMRRDPVVLSAQAPIVDAIQVMMTQHIKRVPVVDQHDRLVGMVDRQAILRALSQIP